MDYISAENFLKQSENVRKTLIDWWQPDYSDLIGEANGDFCLVSELMSPSRPKIFKYKYIDSKKYIPLFTEGQLRDFIEEHYDGKVEAVYSFNGYIIYILDIMATDSDVNNVKEYFETNTIDLLEAYWQVTCKIAKES